MKYILTLIYVFLTTGGLFCFKMSGAPLALSLSFKNGIAFKMDFLTLLGFVFYLGSFLLWQRLLTTNDLSYIVPLTTGIVQVIVLILGYFFFKESINLTNLIGIVLVMIGVILISIKK